MLTTKREAALHKAAMQRRLILELAHAAGLKLTSTQDYEMLSDYVASHTNRRIGVTTLKRMGGYLREGVNGRRMVLETMSRALGYHGYDDYVAYVAATHEEGTQALPPMDCWLDSATLTKGTQVRVHWKPGRLCVLESIDPDNGEWLINETINSRLCAGTRVSQRWLVQGMPLYLYMREGSEPSRIHVCGGKQGVNWELA